MMSKLFESSLLTKKWLPGGWNVTEFGLKGKLFLGAGEWDLKWEREEIWNVGKENLNWNKRRNYYGLWSQSCFSFLLTWREFEPHYIVTSLFYIIPRKCIQRSGTIKLPLNIVFFNKHILWIFSTLHTITPREMPSKSLGYKVNIKTTGCSLNIVFFP